MNEVTVIEHEQFGLEKKEAANIEKAFEPKIKEREILSSQYGELVKKDITQETCAEATELRRKLVKVRTGIADVHKAQKAFFFAAGKFVDAWKNKETLPVTQMEGGLKKIENHFAEIEEAKLEIIRQERNSELAKYEIEYEMGDIAFMTPDIWKHFLSSVRSEFEEKKAEEIRIEKERIKAQRMQDLFMARKEKLIQFSQFNIQNELSPETTEKEFIDIVEKGETMKKEFYAEQKRIKAENDRLKKEQEIKDKRINELRPFMIYIRDYKETISLNESDYQKELIELGLAKKQQEDYESEQELKRQNLLIEERKKNAKIQKELDDKKSADQKAKDAEDLRIKQDKMAARKAELAPDKERMTKWIADMEIIDIVNDRMSKDSVLMASEIIIKFNLFKKWATEKVNEIK